MFQYATRVLMVIGNEVVSTASNWGDVVDQLTNHFTDCPEDAEKPIKLYSFISELSTELDFRVEVKKGELCFDDLQEYSDAEPMFTIDSGDFSGKEFESLEDLQAFIKDKMEAGYIDIDELRNMDIMQERRNTVQFSEAYHDSDEYSIELNNGLASEIADHFGTEFVLASEAIKEVHALKTMTPAIEDQVQEELKKQLAEAQLVNISRNPQDMEECDIDAEIEVLQKRIRALYAEKAEIVNHQAESGQLSKPKAPARVPAGKGRIVE